MSLAASPAEESHAGEGHSWRVFSPFMVRLWIMLVLVTIVSALVPLPLLSPLYFYCYCAFKVVLFFTVGYLAPLTFWAFNALNRGILLAAASATGVETAQGLLHHGHSFHWYELAVKLALILLGFALALDARYDRRISLGPIHFRLVGTPLDS